MVQKKKRLVTTLAVATSIGMVLSACGDGGEGAQSRGFDDCEENPNTCNSADAVGDEELVWVIDGEWSGYSEVYSETSNNYTTQAIEPVFPQVGRWQPDGTWEHNPHVLTEEPEMISEEPLTVAYHINPEGTWGDGVGFSLDDFIYNWYAWSGDEDKCIGCQPRRTSYGGNVEDIVEVDDNEIHVVYEEGHKTPEWMYPMVLTNPAHLAEEYGFEDWQDDPEVMGESLQHFVTNMPEYSAGPFKYVDEEMGDYIELERNDEWVGGDTPVQDNIRIESMEDPETILTELRQGTVHGVNMGRYDPEIVEQLETAEDMNYILEESSNWRHFTLNTQNEFLQDPVMRHATLIAIDNQAVLDRTIGLTYDDFRPKLNHVFRDDSDYFVDLISDAGHGSGDTERAMELLEDEGYTWDDSDQLLTPDGEEVALEYRVPSSGADAQTTAELVQEHLIDIGVDASINTYQVDAFSATLDNAEFDIINFQWTGSPEFANNPQTQWHSSSGSNYGGLDSEEIDDLIAEIYSTVDMDEAAEYANDAVQAVIDEAYVLPQSDSPELLVVQEGIVNVRHNPNSNLDAFYNMGEWGWADE